jgi:hypothetical protein
MAFNEGFTEWFPFDDEPLASVPRKRGIYIVRIKGAEINRFLGKDKEGILHIDSGSLKSKINRFNKRANRLKGGSGTSAGQIYCFLNLVLREDFGFGNLEYCYRLADDRHRANAFACDLQLAYMRKFGELPPLDYGIKSLRDILRR